MESNWRWNVPDQGWSLGPVERLARFLSPPWVGQWLWRRTDGTDFRALLTATPEGIQGITVLAGWPFGWTVPAELGLIEPD